MSLPKLNPFKLFVPHFFTMANAGIIGLAWAIGYFLDYVKDDHEKLLGAAFIVATAYIGAVLGFGPLLVKLNILYRTGWGFTKLDANMAIVILCPFYVFARLMHTVDLASVTTMVIEGMMVGFLTFMLSIFGSLIASSIERAVMNMTGERPAAEAAEGA